MLTRALRTRGLSLIELMITLAVVAVVIFLAAPNFAPWIQNTQIRNGVETMMTGVKLARSEALKRNTPILFQLMTSIDGSCGLSTSGTSWVVSVQSAVGLCDQSDPTAAPFIVREKASGEGTNNVVYAATQPSIGFDALGRVTPTPPGDVVINVTNPTGGGCVTADGPMRCQRIVVSAGGQTRMCDPAVTDSTDARMC